MVGITGHEGHLVHGRPEAGDGKLGRSQQHVGQLQQWLEVPSQHLEYREILEHYNIHQWC